MSTIRVFRPARSWSVSPATVLPAGLLLRLFRLRFNFTVVLDGKAAGKIGYEQVRVFKVDPGEHRLRMRFVLLRRSKEMRVSLKEGEDRDFLCGSNGLGWPTLREVSPEDVAEVRGSSTCESTKPGDPVSPN